MPTVLEALVAAVLLVGTFLTVVTCIGLVRFPDVYCRMHAAGKAGTLGVAFVILAPALYFAPQGFSIPVRGILAIFFQFLTTPAATHLLARASYVRDYPLTERTALDELKTFIRYRPREHYGHE